MLTTAECLLDCETHAEAVAIAAEEGIIRQWASRQAKSAGVQRIFDSLLSARLERFEEVFDAALEAISGSLRARRIMRLRSRGAGGKIVTKAVDVGPDHYAALAGVKALMSLLKALSRICSTHRS